jgi:hypothetical protein
MTWAARLAALALCAGAQRADSQYPVEVDGPPRARATMVVRRALATPHDLIFTDTLRRLILPRGSEVPRTVIVLGGDASVGASIHGDVVVVGGDLFLHPGAQIDGQAIAVGGAVYGSTLASVNGGTENVRDETFGVSQSAAGIVLRWRYIGGREPAVEFPVLDGLRVPSYDRVNGASAPWGPILRPTMRLEADPTVTYRSHIGEWDPGLTAVYRVSERYDLTVDGRRATFTNDAWIHSDPINTINALARGSDTRNYYRADRAELELRRYDEYLQPILELERFAGVAVERAWSVGARDTLGARPWVATGRDDPDKVARPNPPVERGRISSAFVGAFARYRIADVRMHGTIRVEVPWETPANERFGQVTFDGGIRFPTFGLQRFRADLHVVATVGDTAPPQRFAYLGGSGTLPVIDDPLSLGGDQLLHLDTRYEIPISRIRLPFVGSPTISLRHRIGSAGIQRLPRFVQNVGPILTVSFLRVEYLIDPATRESRFKAGLSFAR